MEMGHGRSHTLTFLSLLPQPIVTGGKSGGIPEPPRAARQAPTARCLASPLSVSVAAAPPPRQQARRHPEPRLQSPATRRSPSEPLCLPVVRPVPTATLPPRRVRPVLQVSVFPVLEVSVVPCCGAAGLTI